jgi:putative membrane protein
LEATKNNNSLKHDLILAVQGAIVGVGAILPGVSGGVMLVAFGIYDPLMELLSHPKEAIRKHGRMFVPFVIGWVLGFVLLANAVELLFETSSAVALMLFAGLICGTVPALLKKSELADKTQGRTVGWTPLVLTLAGAYLFFSVLSNSTGGSIQPNTWWYLFCGLVWGLSMVVPGLSSSSILIFMGLYEPMTAGIARLDFGVILPLVIGLVITVAATARYVNGLLQSNYALASRIVLGFMLASTLLIFPTSFPDALTLVISLACFAGGFVVAYRMDQAEERDGIA